MWQRLPLRRRFTGFDREAARIEFLRILQPDGWVFLIWNNWHSCSSPFNDDFRLLLRSMGDEFDRARDRSTEINKSLAGFFAPGSFASGKFPNPQVMDRAALRGRFLSVSYVPPENDLQSQTLLAKLNELFDRHQKGGVISLEQETNVYFGQMR